MKACQAEVQSSDLTSLITPFFKLCDFSYSWNMWVLIYFWRIAISTILIEVCRFPHLVFMQSWSPIFLFLSLCLVKCLPSSETCLSRDAWRMTSPVILTVSVLSHTMRCRWAWLPAPFVCPFLEPTSYHGWSVDVWWPPVIVCPGPTGYTSLCFGHGYSLG